jgi:hypothetical protein
MRAAEGKTHAVILDAAGNYQRCGLPDDPVEWTLEGRVRAAAAPSHRTCPECFAIYPSGAVGCPACQHVAEPMPQPVREVRAEMERVQRKTREAIGEGLYWRSLLEARSNGWTIKAAKVKVAKTIGWPTGMWKLEQAARKGCHHQRVENNACRFCGRAGVRECKLYA